METQQSQRKLSDFWAFQPYSELMEQSSATLAEPAANKFSVLPERTLPEDYVQEVDVDVVNYVEPKDDEWVLRVGLTGF